MLCNALGTQKAFGIPAYQLFVHSYFVAGQYLSALHTQIALTHKPHLSGQDIRPYITFQYGIRLQKFQAPHPSQRLSA